MIDCAQYLVFLWKRLKDCRMKGLETSGVPGGYDTKENSQQTLPKSIEDMACASDGILEGSGLSIVLDLVQQVLTRWETLYQKSEHSVTKLDFIEIMILQWNPTKFNTVRTDKIQCR